MARIITRVTGLLLIFLLLLLASMIGFYYIKIQEGGDPTLIDAFSWTMITLSTLGSYSSALSLESDLGYLFTSVVVILGISVVFIGMPFILVPWIEKKVGRALKHKLIPIPIPVRNHVIICGFNQTVDEIMDVLKLHGVPFVVLEHDLEKLESLERRKIPYVTGDPTDEDTLRRAYVESAFALIAAKDDEANAFICLTAKAMQPDLRVVSSAENIDSVKALFAAEATKVVVPKLFAGNILGQRACHDYSIDVSGKFANLGDLEVRQYAILSRSPLVDSTIADSRIHSQAGAIIAGLWKEGTLTLNPSPDEVLTEGTTIIALGTESQLDTLYRLVRNV